MNSNLTHNKESFLLYKAFYEPLKHLSDQELGILFRLIFEYQINPNNPVGFEVPGSVQMAFEFIKNQFRLDGAKYDRVVERNRNNGAKGGRPRKENPSNPNNPVGFNDEKQLQEQEKPAKKAPSPKPKKPKKADNDNENEKENDKELNIIVEHYNKIFGKSIRSTESFRDNYQHWSKIHPLDAILKAITNARKDGFWKDKMTLTILFRQKTPQGERADYIENLSNRTPQVGDEKTVIEKEEIARKERERQLIEDRKTELSKLKSNFDHEFFDAKYGEGKWKRWAFGRDDGKIVIPAEVVQECYEAFKKKFPKEEAEISKLSEHQ